VGGVGTRVDRGHLAVGSGNPFVGAVQCAPRDGASHYLPELDWASAASVLLIEDDEARERKLL